LKRAFKKKSKAEIENSSSDDVPVEHLNKTVNSLNNHRMPSKAAMIALAISMGATSLLVTRQSDQALAAKPVGSQKANIKTAAPDTKVNFATTKLLESQAVSSASVPTNPAIVEPTVISQVPGLGAKLQATAAKDTVATTVSIASSSSSTSEPQTAKLATVKQEQTNNPNNLVVSTTDSSDAKEQLKAQQEFALNRLQEKSNRLKTGLAELRSEETNAVSVNSQDSATSANQASLANKLRRARTENNQVSSVARPVPVKPVVAAQPNTTTYQVKAGDTLAAIAQAYGTSVSEIIRANTLANPYQLRISQKLNIPASGNTISSANTTGANDQESSQTRHTGIGGENPEPTALTEMQVADIRVSQAKNLKNNPRLNSLRKEIERLRAKYRAQQSGNQFTPEEESNTSVVGSAVSRPNSAGVPIFVPQPMSSGVNTRSIRPQFFPSRFRNPVASPNRGPSDTDSLGRFRGTVVSPNTKSLPPLAAVDRYLPRPIDDVPQSSSAYIWPAKGTLTSGYGWRWGRMHKGIDIANSTGTPVYAAADGVVASAGWNRGGYGKLVEVRHANGSVTRYAHNSKILVQVGQEVQQGNTIALMGSTGFSTGPHTHFEIRPGGQEAVNPVAFLPPRV
jgi:murein DD-endopeptidase MepM/ murein hydrolase activator NlpD